MKKIKCVAIPLLIIFIAASCNNNIPKEKETKDTIVVASIDSSNKPATAKPTSDSSSKKELMITAMFVDFSLGDASHFTFKDKNNKIWDFAKCTDEKFQFAMELPASKADESNQGWSANKKLQGKWFQLTYEFVMQPEYQDGPIAKVPIITKVSLVQ